MGHDILEASRHEEKGLHAGHWRLVALRLTPANGRTAFHYEERYEIGRFKTGEGSRKAWWVTTSASGRDPVKLRKH